MHFYFLPLPSSLKSLYLEFAMNMDPVAEKSIANDRTKYVVSKAQIRGAAGCKQGLVAASLAASAIEHCLSLRGMHVHWVA